MATAIAGCATQGADWNARVGHYTYNQAVAEFGPPSKQTKWENGQLVADWVTPVYNGSTATVGEDFNGNPDMAVGVIPMGNPPNSESTMQLTFTNNVLESWSRR